MSNIETGAGRSKKTNLVGWFVARKIDGLPITGEYIVRDGRRRDSTVEHEAAKPPTGRERRNKSDWSTWGVGSVIDDAAGSSRLMDPSISAEQLVRAFGGTPPGEQQHPRHA